MQEAKITWTT